MLVLFILSITLLNSNIKAKQEQLDKITEIEQATKNIDSTYFWYSPTYKKHILKINVNFKKGSSELKNDIDSLTLAGLKKAGISIKDFIEKISEAHPEVQYLLIIEGQASRDDYKYNYELSYKRALALKDYWEKTGLDFGEKCEVLISGSGDGTYSGTGFMREKDEPKNQRFLIHILPKPGIVK